MKVISIVLLSILTFGCATSPEVLLNQTPVEVTKENINEYWENKNKTFSFKLPLKATPKSMNDGFVTFRFLIDSNGNSFNPEIIESKPEGAWDYAGVKALSKQAFIPAKSNTERVPVYYTQTIFFNSAS